MFKADVSKIIAEKLWGFSQIVIFALPQRTQPPNKAVLSCAYLYFRYKVGLYKLFVIIGVKIFLWFQR